MAEPFEVDKALIAEVDSVDEAWQRQLVTQETLIQAESIGGLLVYEFQPGDELAVTFTGLDAEHDNDRSLVSHIINKQSGALEVASDTEELLQGHTINLGSFANHAGRLHLVSPGLLRGFLMLGGGVAIDPDGTHFTSDNILYLPAEYNAISVNGFAFGQTNE